MFFLMWASCKFNDDIRKALEDVIPIIETHENAEIMIVAYTDVPDPGIHKKNLSLNRAKACEDWLRQNAAIKNQTFVVKVLGSKTLTAPDDVEKNRRRNNRRVQIIIKKND